ncbi:hypothetical protein ACQ4WX_36110 [Streptomyces lasalocidi]
MLRFSVLGPLEIRTDVGPADVPGDLQRILVQTLLVSEVAAGVRGEPGRGDVG